MQDGKLDETRKILAMAELLNTRSMIAKVSKKICTELFQALSHITIIRVSSSIDIWTI